MSLHARPMRDDDTPAVLELVNSDRLPCQPLCSPAMLDEARAGRSSVDAGWFAGVEGLRVDVLEGAAGELAGVVSYGHHPGDETALILWLHGREDASTVGALVEHALAGLGEAPVTDAFPFSTALGLGVEALPVTHRPVTHRVLLGRGFRVQEQWRYLCRKLPATELMPRGGSVRVSRVENGRRRLTFQSGDRVVGEATVGIPEAGVGTVWWIEVDPDTRGAGIGRALFGGALDLLARSGAREAVLYVDEGAFRAESDRAATRALYHEAGFVEVDRLVCLRLAPSADPVGGVP